MSSKRDTELFDDFVVLVPLSNPESEYYLISLGAAIANHRNGRVVAVSVVNVPDQTSLYAAREQFDYEASSKVLAGAQRSASEFNVPIETHVIFSHNIFESIFDTARQYEADVCVIGCGTDLIGVSGRAEPITEELANSLPCDFLVFKDRGFDPSRVLLPTTGGPHTDVAALVASILREEYGSNVTVMHVSDDLEDGRKFLISWAEDHNLSDADLRTESGDVEAAIEDAAEDHTMILIGATESGVLHRIALGSLTLDVLNDIERSMLITEQQTKRSLLKRVFGR